MYQRRQVQSTMAAAAGAARVLTAARRLAAPSTPSSSPMSSPPAPRSIVGANKFAELVKQRTNGEVEIKVFPAGQLGGERAIIEGVQLGTIEMSFTTTGAIGGFAPEFQVLDLPFLFPTYEVGLHLPRRRAAARSSWPPRPEGIHGVVFLENGWRNFTPRRSRSSARRTSRARRSASWRARCTWA